MKYICYLFLLLSAFSSRSQTIAVVDQENNPLPFAHLNCKGINSENEHILIADEQGIANLSAEFTAEHPVFVVTISFMGFESLTDTMRSTENKMIALKHDEVTLNQVVVTAQYTPTAVEQAVHKIKIIDRKQIDAQGAVTLNEVLQKEVNMRISQDQVLGSSVSMQGVSGQNVKILVDGVPIIGRQNGNIDLSQINLSAIERIEMVEGPLSVTYGTDALAGTINLITRKEVTNKVNIALNSYYESVGQYNMDGRLGLAFGKHQLQLSGGRNYFDGWSASDDFIQFPTSLLADSGRVHQWNPKEQYMGSIQYSYRFKKVTLRPYATYFTETITNRGAPRLPFYETAFDDSYVTDRFNKGIEVNGQVGANKNITFLAANNTFERTKNTWFRDLTTLEKSLTTSPSDQDTSTFELYMSRASFNTSRDSTIINYEIGYDVNYETASGKRIEGQDKELGDYAIYSTAEINASRQLIIRPGIRYTYNTEYKAPLIPSLNLKYQLKPFTFRVSYAKGFRAPSLKELHFEFVDINHNILGNKDLKAERSDNFQWNVNWKKVKAKKTIQLDLNLYYNDIEDLISLSQISGESAFTYVNIGTFKTMGAQTSTSYSIKHIDINVGGAYVGRYNDLSKESSVSTFSYSPEVRSNVIYNLHQWKSTVAVFYKYTGALPGYFSDPEDNIVETNIDDYHTLDLTLSKSFWNDKIKWTLGGKNLFDVQNITSSNSSGGVHSSSSGSVPVSWGRTFFTSVNLNFNL